VRTLCLDWLAAWLVEIHFDVWEMLKGGFQNDGVNLYILGSKGLAGYTERAVQALNKCFCFMYH
jgi:hypothetical protein